jgi:hypothetical protein
MTEMLRTEVKFCFAHNQKQTQKSRSWRTEHNSDRKENNSFRLRILPIALFGRIVLRSNKQVSMMGDNTIVCLLLLYCSHEYYVCLLKDCYVDCEKCNSFRLRIVRIALFGSIVLRSNKQLSMWGLSHFFVITAMKWTSAMIHGDEARESKLDAIVFSCSSEFVIFTIACANSLKNFRYLAVRAAKDPIIHHRVMSGSCIAWSRFFGGSTEVNISSGICDL